MLAITLLIVAFLLLQDTTVVAPAAGVGLIGFVVGYVLKNVVPLVSSWLFQWWNTQRDSWYATKSNPVKMAVYVVVTVVFMFLFSVVGIGWDETFDPETLTPEFFQNLIVALISTFLVKVGIRTEQARSGKAAAKKAAKARADDH